MAQLCNVIVLAFNVDTFWPPSQVAPHLINDRVSLTFNFGNFLCTCQPS